MQPRFVGRVGVADAVSVGNAVLGFLAVLAATVDPALAARLVLLAAILDAVDGLAARRFGATPTGRPLDSLADVGSFAVAPAMIVVIRARDAGVVSLTTPDAATVVAVAAAAAYVAMAVLRLALYTVEDFGDEATRGVQSTLAGTVLAAAVLAGPASPVVLLAATALFAYLMVVPVQYPDLRPRDAVAAGAVQALAVLAPTAMGRLFPRAVLVLSLAYLALAPVVYPGPDRENAAPGDRRVDRPSSGRDAPSEGAGSGSVDEVRPEKGSDDGGTGDRADGGVDAAAAEEV